jgi:hypothetical protein
MPVDSLTDSGRCTMHRAYRWLASLRAMPARFPITAWKARRRYKCAVFEAGLYHELWAHWAAIIAM